MSAPNAIGAGPGQLTPLQAALARLTVLDEIALHYFPKRALAILGVIIRCSLGPRAVPRTKAVIPLLDYIVEATGIARGHVSLSIKQLKSWRVVREQPPGFFCVNPLFADWRLPRHTVSHPVLEQLALELEPDNLRDQILWDFGLNSVEKYDFFDFVQPGPAAVRTGSQEQTITGPRAVLEPDSTHVIAADIRAQGPCSPDRGGAAGENQPSLFLPTGADALPRSAEEQAPSAGEIASVTKKVTQPRPGPPESVTNLVTQPAGAQIPSVTKKVTLAAKPLISLGETAVTFLVTAAPQIPSPCIPSPNETKFKPFSVQRLNSKRTRARLAEGENDYPENGFAGAKCLRTATEETPPNWYRRTQISLEEERRLMELIGEFVPEDMARSEKFWRYNVVRKVKSAVIESCVGEGKYLARPETNYQFRRSKAAWLSAAIARACNVDSLRTRE